MSGERELDAAGITDPRVRAGYAGARALNAQHGRTYFLATRLLPAARRPAVHALYGFARLADEVVDDLADTRPAAERLAELEALRDRLRVVLADPAAAPADTHPVLLALADTVGRYDIDPRLFDEFCDSMLMDAPGSPLAVAEYPTMADLARYVRGSAEVIGLQMVPVLGVVGDRAAADECAAALGLAFQLTNFLRDVGEDLDRGRVYLPLDELAAFGVDRALLLECRRTGRQDPRVRAALAHLVALTRGVYRRAEPGIALLAPESRPCVWTARVLYGEILDRIEEAGGAVLDRRVSVPPARRAAVAGPGLVRAVLARSGRRRPEAQPARS